MPGPIDDQQSPKPVNPTAAPVVINLPTLDPNASQGWRGIPFRGAPAYQNPTTTANQPNALGNIWWNNTGVGFGGNTPPVYSFQPDSYGVKTASVSGYGGAPLGGLGVGGSIGPRMNPTAGGGAGRPVNPANVRVDYSKKVLDARLGQGWVDDFMKHHGTDPITFFAKNFPHLEGDPERQVGAALDYAEKYGRFIPDAVADWQMKHGNTPIPDEQWQTWDRMIQQGGQPQYGGQGIDPYRVY